MLHSCLAQSAHLLLLLLLLLLLFPCEPQSPAVTLGEHFLAPCGLEQRYLQVRGQRQAQKLAPRLLAARDLDAPSALPLSPYKSLIYVDVHHVAYAWAYLRNKTITACPVTLPRT
jgi:hypothetical protein